MNIDVVEGISRLIAMIVGIVGFISGLILVFKPPSLQKLSQLLNKKFSFGEKLQHTLDKEINADKWLVANSRIIGTVVIVLSVIILLLTLQTV